MTRACVLALSQWAHHSWRPHGKRALGERGQAIANADLLARFPQLAAVRATPVLPPFAQLPRPAYARVLRMTAALAHASSLCKLISESDHEAFAARIAPNLLLAIQRDSRNEFDDMDVGVAPNVLDRVEMTAAGLRIALHACGDPASRVLMQLRVARAVAQRVEEFGVGEMSERAAGRLLETAYVRARGEAC